MANNFLKRKVTYPAVRHCLRDRDTRVKQSRAFYIYLLARTSASSLFLGESSSAPENLFGRMSFLPFRNIRN